MSINRAKALKSAQKYLAKGQIDRAISEYEKVVEEDPKDARSLLKLGDLYTRAGDAKGAITAYRKVAEQYAGQGFFLKAVAVYKQILKLDKTDLPAWEKLASMYEKLSLASDALTTFEQVADAYTRMGKSREALRSLGKVAELDPENVASWIRYAEALSKADHIDDATDAFRRGANLLKQQGRLDDYLKVAERLLFHNNEDVDLAREVAAMYLERGNAKAALSHLQTSFKADPRDVATLELLAQAFQVLGQMKKAAAVYREIARVHADADRSEDEAQALRGVLSLAPEDPESQRRLHEIGTRSIEILDEADDEMDDDVIIVDEGSGVAAAPRPSSAPPASKEAQIARLLSECEVFVRYGLRDKVISQLNKVLDLDPDHIAARERLKDSYLQDGQVDEALTQLLLLSEIAGASDPQRARGYLAEASQLSPDNAPVASRLRELQSVVPANDVPAPSFDHEDEDEHDHEDEENDEDEDELIILDDEDDAEAAPVGTSAFDDESTFGDVRVGSAPPDAVEDDGVFAELMAEADADTHAEVETYEALDDDDDEPELLLEDSGETFESLDLDDADMMDEPAPTPAPPPRIAPPPGRALGEPSMRIRPPQPQVSAPPPIPRIAVSQPLRSPVSSKIAPPRVSPPPDSVPPDSLPPNTYPPDSFPAEPATSPSHRVMSDEESGDLPEEIGDALEEADFYLAQELFDEARDVLEDALSDFPDHPALTAKLREIDDAGDSASEDTEPTSLPVGRSLPATATTEDQSFALAQKLADEVRGAGQGGPIGVDEVLHQFKEGVKNQVDRADTATHYDLGIAYMEMGLHAEAIEEFRLCLDSPDKECTAHTMIGLSYVSKGDMQAGVEHFQQALGSRSVTPAEELDLWFEIGNAYELLGKASEALVWYEKVEERNPEFRDVATRIERLGHAKSDQEEVDEFDAMFDNMILKD